MKKVFYLFCALLVGIIIGWLMTTSINDKCLPEGVGGDTITKYDTVFFEKPVATDSVIVSYITRWLPTRSSLSNHDVDSTGVFLNSGYKALDSVVKHPPDSCEVIIPIGQKAYNTADYTAWVSGYEAKLDSINIYRRTNTVSRYIEKKKEDDGDVCWE